MGAQIRLPHLRHIESSIGGTDHAPPSEAYRVFSWGHKFSLCGAHTEFHWVGHTQSFIGWAHTEVHFVEHARMHAHTHTELHWVGHTQRFIAGGTYKVPLCGAHRFSKWGGPPEKTAPLTLGTCGVNQATGFSSGESSVGQARESSPADSGLLWCRSSHRLL